jgi:DNA-binding MurR/RpiR family transcriptional regulator
LANRVLLSDAPISMEALQEMMQVNFEAFSPRGKEVASLAMREPLRIATESVTALASHIGVPPSTFTRFAQVLGFRNFMVMQALFKTQYVDRPRDYLERIRQSRSGTNPLGPSLQEDFAQAAQESIRLTSLELSATKLQEAVRLMRGASEIWIHGVRRAFPVAAYLQYLLLKSGVRASLLDGHGGLLAPSLCRLHPAGVLLMVTYSPHAAESEQVIHEASRTGTPVIAITDPMPSPFVKEMTIRFEIREGEVMGFRSLSASMYLAQTLVVALAQDLS